MLPRIACAIISTPENTDALMGIVVVIGKAAEINMSLEVLLKTEMSQKMQAPLSKTLLNVARNASSVAENIVEN